MDQSKNISADNLKKIALEEIHKNRNDILELSRYINSHPETAYEEKKSSAALISFFKKRDFGITAPLCGVDTAFSADFVMTGEDTAEHQSGCDVAFMAEYDALKDVGHGCGHNLIAASAAGAAAGTAGALIAAGPDFRKKDGSRPSFRVIGTPAEEVIDRIAGKKILLDRGAFKDVRHSLMFHPWTDSGVALKDLGASACRVFFHGRAAHAAADPWNGKNALDAAVLFYNSISMLRQQLKPGLKMHCILPDAGTAVNVIPETSSAEVMFRSTELEDLDGIVEKLRDCAAGAATATGCTSEFKLLSTMKPVLFDRELFNLLKNNMKSEGEDLREIPVWKASSDFGDVSRKMPSLSLLYKTHGDVKSWHSREVAEAAAGPQAEEAMLRAAGYLAMTAIDLFFL